MLVFAAVSAFAQKVAVVDETMILNSLSESKQVEAELKALIGRWADTAAMYTKLITERTERFKNTSKSMSNAARKVELDTISMMQRSLSNYAISKQQTNVGELAQERARRYGPIMQKYRAAVAKVAKRDGYDIVMNRLAYYFISGATPDISEKVITELQ